jgi:hypothetical protein
MADEETRAQLEIDPAFRTVEMKLTARARDEDEVLAALERADVEPQTSELYFFDTPQLSLFEAGIVLRARVVHGGRDDSTVRVRPVDPKAVGEEWKDHPLLGFEVESVGDGYVSSARLSDEREAGEIQGVLEGNRDPRTLFSAEQLRFLAEHAPAGAAVEWERFRVLGPVRVHTWAYEPAGLGHELKVEEWVLPDRSDLLELSIDVEPAAASEANARFVEYLRTRGFDLEGEPRTKTRTALEHLAGTTRG